MLLCSNVNATINFAVNAEVLLNGCNAPSETLNEPLEYLLVIDITTNLNVAEDLLSRDKALIITAL